MILKLLLGLFSVVILFQAHQVYADEELPIITIDFVTGDVIDLNETPQLIRADVQIQNYNPQDGYHVMQIIRISDREVVKESYIFPKIIKNNLYGVQISHYIEPDTNEETLIGDYVLRIYSQFGSGEAYSPFSIVKPNIPIATNNTVKESETENQVESKSKIPSWVHDVFVWYAEETISEDELLTALEYLISQGIINVNSN